jgi:hypothetical protein
VIDKKGKATYRKTRCRNDGNVCTRPSSCLAVNGYLVRFLLPCRPLGNRVTESTSDRDDTGLSSLIHYVRQLICRLVP